MSAILQSPPWSHETHLASVATSAGEARAFVSVHLIDHQLLYLVEDVRLVVSELVTNSVLHARTPITVAIQWRPLGVMLTVHDGSPSLPVRGVADVDSIGGRGLEIVEKCSSDWGVSPGCDDDKVVWASFALRPPLMTAS